MIVGLLAVCCAGAGFYGYRVLDRPWPQVDGLADPAGAVDRVVTALLPTGAQGTDAVTDGPTLYRVAGSGLTVRVTAQPLADDGHRWTVDLPVEQRVLGVRLTLLGDLLFVAIALAVIDTDNQLYHVLRVGDGTQTSAETWRANSGRVEGLFVGAHLISGLPDENSPKAGTVRRRDQRTGADVCNQRLSGKPIEVVAPTVWPGTGPAGGTAVPPADGTASPPGLAFVMLDRSRSVVAYDLATLTEKWRKVVPGQGRARLVQCGARSLCVHTGSVESGGDMLVLDAVTGFTGGGPQTFGADVRTLAAAGGTALMSVSAQSPWPDAVYGHHAFVVDLDGARMSEPVLVGAVAPKTARIVGGLALVVTDDATVMVLRNPFRP